MLDLYFIERIRLGLYSIQQFGLQYYALETHIMMVNLPAGIEITLD